MDTDPERTADDFYRNYDPMVGIGTAGILILFILLVSIKSIIRWVRRRWRILTYERQRIKEAKAELEAKTVMVEADNNHIGQSNGVS